MPIQKFNLIVGFTFLAVGISAQESWNLLKNQDGITIYWRSVPGSSFNQIKATFVLQSPVKTALSLLTDIKYQNKYIYSCDSSKLIRYSEPHVRIIYHRFKMPWPISDRDDYCIQRISRLGTSKYQIETKNTTGKEYPLTSCVRIPYEHSVIQLTAMDETRTYVEYQLKTEPGGLLPAWAVNAMIDVGPFNTIKNIQQILKSYHVVSDEVKSLN